MFSFDEIALKFQNQEKTKFHLALALLGIAQLSKALNKGCYERGPKGYFAEDMIYALVAKHLEKRPTVKRLVHHENPLFRYVRGFQVLKGW